MTNHNLKNRKKAPLRQWGLGVVAIVLLLIFGISKIGSLSSKKIFTEYPPLFPDTLALDTVGTENPAASDSAQSDSLPAEDELTATADSTTIPDSLPTPVVPAESPAMNLFRVNTRFDKIDSPTAITTGKTEELLPQAKRSEADLFEELLLPENAEESYVEAFQQFAEAPIVSSKSVLVMLSVLGKQILLAEQADDARHMLEGLTESEGLVEVLIADRNGRVVYASQPQRINTMIESWLPELGLQADRLSWFRKEGKTITAIPVFHRYGKLGIAVMVAQ